jgi:Family of unknown function (DUF6599)
MGTRSTRSRSLVLRLSKFIVLIGLFIGLSNATAADQTSPELSQLLPDRIGDFRRMTSVAPPDSLTEQGILSDSASPIIAGQAKYAGNHNESFLVEVVRFHQDTEAYSILSVVAARLREKQPTIELSVNHGTAGVVAAGQTAFFKGTHFVRVTSLSRGSDVSQTLNTVTRSLSEQFDAGEGSVPVLLKHLPNPEEAQKNAVFLTRFTNLQQLAPEQSVLTAVEARGDADAAFATIGSSRILIVEFNTPQLAAENDQRIVSRIQELWKLGQLAPTAYRRVGNYSVFVFDSPDEQTAKQLIDQVKYEQVVQWLGENPYIYKEAEQRYIDTTLGVFVAVVKASGYALIACVGIGGLLGALLFTRRRAQQREVEAFSDAGGMLRLNLDELTPQTDPARLLRDRN